MSEAGEDAPPDWLAVVPVYVDRGPWPSLLLGNGAEPEVEAEPDREEAEEPPPLTGDPDVALGLPLVRPGEEARGEEASGEEPPGEEAPGCEDEPAGCTSVAEPVELDAPASGPVPLLEEVRGRMPLETDDSDEGPTGPATLLVGA